jgi:hypothetical protein
MEQRTVRTEEITPEVRNTGLTASSAFRRIDEEREDTALVRDEAETVEVVGAELSRLVDQNLKSAGRAIWSIPLSYVLLTILLLLRLIGLSSPLLYLPVLLLWAGVIVAIGMSVVKPRKKYRPLAQTLVDLNDIRAIGPLIDALKVEDKQCHAIAKEGLIQLLPRLQPSDAELLTAEQRRLLWCKLSWPIQGIKGNLLTLSPDAYRTEVSFRIAILQALAQVGDSNALPLVERLAQGKAKTEELRQIQAAAQACLPSLLLRCEQIRSHTTLLRAADASGADAETLLRPVQETRETHPEQLLRPGSPVP